MTARWPLLRVLLTGHVAYIVLSWLVFLAVSAVILTGVALWGQVGNSVWHYLVTQVPRWFALGLGIDVITTYLRLHIAHGRTRRDFLRQLLPYFPCFAVCFAALVTIGYQLERGVYALAGWEHRTAFPTLFGDTGNVLGMLGVFTLMLMLWSIAGVMIAAGFTRDMFLGFVTIPFGLLIVAPSEVLVGLNGVPLFDRLTEPLQLPLLTAVAVGLGGGVLGCAAVWGIVRDMPMRPKVA
jgi:hypothetical protein